MEERFTVQELWLAASLIVVGVPYLGARPSRNRLGRQRVAFDFADHPERTRVMAEYARGVLAVPVVPLKTALNALRDEMRRVEGGGAQ